jgi:G3E family GTPase
MHVLQIILLSNVISVNVDANVIKRFVSKGKGDVDMIELENGCVCCGPEAGQLAPAVKKLVVTGQERGAPFDHIVIELSGVADPAMVKHLLEEGGVNVEKVITLVDSDNFPTLYHSADLMHTREDLGGGEEIAEVDPCVAMKKVVELLISQIEEADMILANKADLASNTSMKTTLFICEALNPNAEVKQTTSGRLPLRQLLPLLHSHHEHSHEHADCDKHECNDPTHHHEHSHEHADCDKHECNDPTHHHEHSHQHADCDKHECNDPTHDHSHSHNHDNPLAAENLGITNFVYMADRPFSEHRLMSQVIDTWPLSGAVHTHTCFIFLIF